METKYISEEEYLKFKNQLRTVIGGAIIGFIIGVLSAVVNEMPFFQVILMGLAMACVPYAWIYLSSFKVIGCLSFIFKLVAALYLGWIITPIALGYNLYQMKQYEKAVANHLILEKEEKQENKAHEDENVKKIITAIENRNTYSTNVSEKDNNFYTSTDDELPEI